MPIQQCLPCKILKLQMDVACFTKPKNLNKFTFWFISGDTFGRVNF